MNLKPPPRDTRRLWVKEKLRNLEHCQKIGIFLEQGAKQRTMVGHAGPWKWSNDPRYDYATVDPNMIVWDIGDDIVEVVNGVEERRERPWEDTRRDCEGLWDELDEVVHDGVYYVALSGGKGVHTAIYLEDPTDGGMWDGKDFALHDRRQAIADWIDFRRKMKGLPKIVYDPVCISPNIGSRQLREYGSVKTRAKTLFFVGPSGRRPLPATREEAYLQAGIRYPKEIVRVKTVDGLHQARLREALGKPCPQSGECFLTTCDACPY